MSVTIGRGILNWNRYERVTDRYGTVTLWRDDDDEKPASITLPAPGAVGMLGVEICGTRESNHIGDLFRGFSPGGAVVGERFVLGHGRFFVERDSEGVLQVGVRPLVPRETDWLDPRLLYRAHEQTVTLVFVEDEAQP